MIRFYLAAARAALIFVSVLTATQVWAVEATTYPIIIKHAFGTTVIEKKPVRIATVEWANHEVPLALGIVPVGMARANFGNDSDDGILPWNRERLKDLQAAPPVLFDEGDGIDFEAVAATQPDIILAAYSGLSREAYETLSQIAPVVAYPEAPYSTDWRQTIRLNSTGMGMATEGEALIKKIEGDIAAALADHPELKGKSAMFITHLTENDLSIVNFYTTNDTRVKYFADLGLASPKSVVAASQPGKFSGSVSAEHVDSFNDVDIFVTYGGQTLLAALDANPLLSKMPAVANGSLVMLGNNPIGNAANPTPLSVSWVLKDYIALLSEAAKKSTKQLK